MNLFKNPEMLATITAKDLLNSPPEVVFHVFTIAAEKCTNAPSWGYIMDYPQYQYETLLNSVRDRNLPLPPITNVHAFMFWITTSYCAMENAQRINVLKTIIYNAEQFVTTTTSDEFIALCKQYGTANLAVKMLNNHLTELALSILFGV